MPFADLDPTTILVADRFRTELGDIDTLVDSIKHLDIIQTIAVKDLGPDANPRYRLLAGGRRLEAAKRAGLPLVPCKIYPTDTSELKALEIELFENLHRKNLEWTEEINNTLAIDTLKKTSIPGWTSADTARALGVSEGLISQDLELARTVSSNVMPELVKAKTKTEAKQLLIREKEKVANEALVRYVKTAAPKVPQFNNYVVGNFFDIAPHLDPNSIDCIEMDPPWAVAYDDLVERQCELDKNTRSTERFEDWTIEAYKSHVATLASIAMRLLRDDRWLLFWGGLVNHTITVEALTAAGFRVVMPPAIWAKPGAAPTAPQKGYSGLITSYEILYYAAKGTPRVYNIRSNVFVENANTPDRFHPTEKPRELMKAILSTFMCPAQTLLVPFAGSGNSLAAAHDLSIHSMGYDISSSYRDAYVARMVKQWQLAGQNKEGV